MIHAKTSVGEKQLVVFDLMYKNSLGGSLFVVLAEWFGALN